MFFASAPGLLVISREPQPGQHQAPRLLTSILPQSGDVRNRKHLTCSKIIIGSKAEEI
jgi:hypothetical protein